MTAPSNANTSGLSELIQARIGQDFDGECHLTGDEAQQVISVLVTAASAQARIAELEAENDVLKVEVIGLRAAIFGSHDYDPSLRHGNFIEMARATEDGRQGALARATAAEARADRLAKDAKGLLAEIASFGRAFMAAQASLDSTSTPDAYDDAILAASVRYQSMVKTASALYRAALQQETQP